MLSRGRNVSAGFFSGTRKSLFFNQLMCEIQTRLEKCRRLKRRYTTLPAQRRYSNAAIPMETHLGAGEGGDL